MRQRALADDDSQPVIVPRSHKVLGLSSPERARRLRQHLVVTLRAMREKHTAPATTPRAEPEGFAAHVATAACKLCKGWCCKGGGDHAYLDAQTLARVRNAQPGLSRRQVARLYLERVQRAGYEGSCLFHGERGCTLTRSLRSDVCNSYFCAGLEAFMSSGDLDTPVVVIAGEGADMRTSPVLKPGFVR
jgi:hypothetical protein